MKLYLKSLSGKAIQIETDPGDTIRSIKDKCGKVLGHIKLKVCFDSARAYKYLGFQEKKHTNVGSGSGQP